MIVFPPCAFFVGSCLSTYPLAKPYSLHLAPCILYILGAWHLEGYLQIFCIVRIGWQLTRKLSGIHQMVMNLLDHNSCRAAMGE